MEEEQPSPPSAEPAPQEAVIEEPIPEAPAETPAAPTEPLVEEAPAAETPATETSAIETSTAEAAVAEEPKAAEVAAADAPAEEVKPIEVPSAETTSAAADAPSDALKPRTSRQHFSEQPAEVLDLGAKRKSAEAAKKESIGRRRSSMRTKTDSLNSRARLLLGSIISIKKSEAGGELGAGRIRTVRFMNTYQLDPDRPFKPERVEKILKEVLVDALSGPYDEAKCSLKAKQASGAIRAKVKQLRFDRYKFICLVMIGEKQYQDVMVAFRFLWDMERDGFAMFSHETTQVFGVAICFGLYNE